MDNQKQEHFQYVNDPPVEEEYLCEICHDPLLNPVFERNCNQMFCRGCLTNWLANSSTCPHCRSRTSKSLSLFIFLYSLFVFIFHSLYLFEQTETDEVIGSVPRIVTNKLNSLLVFCPVCRAQFERSTLSSHIPKCPRHKYMVYFLLLFFYFYYLYCIIAF